MPVTVVPADTIGAVSALVIVYISLLVAGALALTAFAGYVVYRLYRGQP